MLISWLSFADWMLFIRFYARHLLLVSKRRQTRKHFRHMGENMASIFEDGHINPREHTAIVTLHTSATGLWSKRLACNMYLRNRYTNHEYSLKADNDYFTLTEIQDCKCKKTICVGPHGDRQVEKEGDWLNIKSITEGLTVFLICTFSELNLAKICGGLATPRTTPKYLAPGNEN